MRSALRMSLRLMPAAAAACLMLAGTALAQDKPAKGQIVLLREIPLALTTPDGSKVRRGTSTVQIICLDGYKYLLLGNAPVSGINQMFRWDEALKQTVPVRCSQSQSTGLHKDE